ncbi:hypothetical protein GTY80_02530, partial [Amycolatopsis sp. SID8362]|nr:hypothetical protein [Amycolatopsis sp. SID8362]NED38832.1 hypothetical protein [Amycolatopsis sp. SID8362]
MPPRSEPPGRSAPGSPARQAPPAGEEAWAEADRPQTVAIGLAAAGALALAAGAIAHVSPDAGPGFTSWPWLAVLA